MKVSASALLAVAALAGTAAAQWCPTTTVRKEFRQMTNNERQRYFSAVRQLNSGSRPNQFDRFAQVHVWFANEIHGVAPFLVWHRQFVRDWEQTLQRVSGDSSVFQPYWDWTNDSQNPAGSPIFSGNWLGGDGRGGCANIPMLGGQVPVWWDGNYQQYQHCLTRNFNREVMRAFYPRSALQVVFDQSRDYARLNPGIEIGPHSNVHVAVGGHMNSMASPNDPVFWFHHAFIDKLWNDWVNVDYNNRLWSYGGPNRNGASASYNDRLPYYGMQVWTVMPLGNMCYNYGNAGPFKRDAGAESSANDTLASASLSAPQSGPAKSSVYIPQSQAEVAHIRAPVGGAINIMPPKGRKVQFSLISDIAGMVKNVISDLLKPHTEKFVPKINQPLKHVAPLPESFLRMNNIDLKLARAWENRIDEHINNVNTANGFADNVVALAPQP